MPRTAGTYVVPSGTKGVTLETIQSGKYNAFLDDLTFDLNDARPVTAGGTGATTEDGAAETLGLVSAKDLAGVNTVGGTANAITIVTARDYDAYENTLYLTFKAASDIAAGGTTIDLDGNGAKPLYKNVAAGYVDVNLGDIIAGGRYTMTYDTAADGGDGAFILLNPGTAGDPFVVGTHRDSSIDLGPNYLKRDGALYDKVDYPELGAIMPALPDGVIWSNNAITGTISKVIHDGARYVGVGGSVVVKSTDGKNYDIAYNIPAGYSAVSIAHGLGIYVALLIEGADSSKAHVITSTDLETWSAPASISSTGRYMDIAFGNSLFVVVGTGGKIRTTPDGISFTTQTSGVATDLNAVIYDGTNWIAVGATGTIITATAAATAWTTRTSGVSVTLNGVSVISGTIVVVGNTGTILSSTNLSGWTGRTSGTTTNLNASAGNASGLIVVGASGLARIAATISSTWTAAPTGSSGALRSIVIDPSSAVRYIVAGATNIILEGLRTTPDQFRVPNDDPTYGYIRAVS